MSGPPRPTGAATLRPMLLAVAIAGVGSMPVFLLGGLAVLVRADLGFSEARLGVIVGAFFAAAAAGAVPAGIVSDRVGPTRAVVLGLGVSAGALTVSVLSTVWWHLMLAMVLGGGGHAILQVATNLLLAGRVAPRNQGLAFGIKQSAVPAVILVAGASLPLMAVRFGWRTVYLAAVVAAVTCLGWQLRRVGRDLAASRPRKPTGAVPSSRRALIVLAIAAGLGAGTANALGAFFVEFAVHSGVPLGRAGVLLAISSGASVAVRVLAGHLSDRRGSAGLGAMAVMLGLGALAYLVLPAVGGWTFGLTIAGVVAFGAGWGWPGVLNHVVTLRNPDAPAAAAGIVHTGVYIGGVTGPVLMGLTVSGVSYTAAWIGAGVAVSIGAVLVFAVRTAIDGGGDEVPVAPRHSADPLG